MNKKKKTTAVAVRKERVLSLANRDDVNRFGAELKKFITEHSLSVKIADKDYCKVDGWKFAAMNFGLLAIPGKPVSKHVKGEYIVRLYAMREFVVPSGKNKGKKYRKETLVFVGFYSDKTVVEEMRKRNAPITKEVTSPYFEFECDVELVNAKTRELISRGTGVCSNMEAKKASFDLYGISGMSETRGIGRAIRNILGHVMTAADHEGTTAEEADGTESWDDAQIVESEGSKPEVEPGSKEEESILAQIKSGKLTVAQVKENKTINETQEKAMDILERRAKKSN